MERNIFSRKGTILLIFLAILLMGSCRNFGTEKKFNGTQMFYTSTVTENEVDILGAYLINSGFADGEQKTVQLNKSGNTYEFRMVVKKGIEQDQEYRTLGKAMASEISLAVFNGSNVDLHLCDENLKTLIVLPMYSNGLIDNQISQLESDEKKQNELNLLEGTWINEYNLMFIFHGNKVTIIEDGDFEGENIFEYDHNKL
jgi:hypothetical protein